MAFKFENLEIWKEALEINNDVNKLTQKFPRHEQFVLTSQLRRAADSAVLNIAEGSQGQSNAEFARFLNMAIHRALKLLLAYFSHKNAGILRISMNSTFIKILRDS